MFLLIFIEVSSWNKETMGLLAGIWYGIFQKKKKEMMWLAYTAEFVEQKRLDVPITLHKRFDVMR